MKIFKRIILTAIAIYLLSIVGCRKNRVEVIHSEANPLGHIERTDGSMEIDYPVNGVAGFSIITRGS